MDHSREAAGAVHGALPLIRRAQHMTVLIGEGKENFGCITRYPKLDIVSYLNKHNSQVSARKLEVSGDEAGAKILHAAWQTNADLLVMGAYGRMAWREFFPGGATRHIFKHMTLPVLMVH